MVAELPTIFVTVAADGGAPSSSGLALHFLPDAATRVEQQGFDTGSTNDRGQLQQQDPRAGDGAGLGHRREARGTVSAISVGRGVAPWIATQDTWEGTSESTLSGSIEDTMQGGAQEMHSHFFFVRQWTSSLWRHRWGLYSKVHTAQVGEEW